MFDRILMILEILLLIWIVVQGEFVRFYEREVWRMNAERFEERKQWRLQKQQQQLKKENSAKDKKGPGEPDIQIMIPSIERNTENSVELLAKPGV